MIFTQLARVVAILMLLYGVLRIGIGATIINETLLPYSEALAKYAPGASSAGEVIDRGIYTVLLAIALGVLAEISIAIRKI